ncbi:hypothetical protein ACFO8O_01590 [Hephaestia sp. GCM10023244]|uniref:hypothetical protein n=1 Tax=unclassified Hephaestia TaxID=2631281 RepID=UPI00207775D8|nr:hypothetical protein [Hephaestia sp. MAHUQ-44]MCM8729664.1 hypothetical protein [Hephaestia sp. MAHUQ-44]
MPRAPITIIVAGMLAAFALAACGREAPNAAAPSRVAGFDPALAEALADPILVDPDLGQQANGDALRPPDRPPSGGLPPIAIAPLAPPVVPAGEMPAPHADCPACKQARGALTLGALAAVQADPALRGCAAQLRYSARWAARMPAALPLASDARVLIAAGADSDRCALRAVRFVSAASVEDVMRIYHAHAAAAGFTADYGMDGALAVLRGSRARGRHGYVVVAQPYADGGSLVDLVVNAAG